MKIRLAYPVDEMVGKAGGDFGIVMSVWRGLQVARRLVVPANPSTTEQDTIRGYLATAAAAFQSVTAAEKILWETFADLMASRIMGQMVVRPAISEYCRINVLRQIDGEATTDAAPTAKPDFAITGITAFEFDDPNDEMNIVFTHNAAVTTNKMVLCRWTNALPSGVVVPRDSDFRLAEGVGSTGSIIDLSASPQTAAFTAPISLLAVDDWAGVRLTPLSPDYVPGVQFGDTLQVTAE